MQTRCWRGDPVYKAIPRGCKVLVYFADIAQHSTYSKRSACFMFYPSPLATARCGLCQLSLEWPLINTKLRALMSFWVGVCLCVCTSSLHKYPLACSSHSHWGTLLLGVCVCVCTVHYVNVHIKSCFIGVYSRAKKSKNLQHFPTCNHKGDQFCFN